MRRPLTQTAGTRRGQEGRVESPLRLVDSFVRSVRSSAHAAAEPQCRFVFQADEAAANRQRLVRQVLFVSLSGPSLASVEVLDGDRSVFTLDSMVYGGYRRLSAGEVLLAMAAYADDPRASIALQHAKVPLDRLVVRMDFCVPDAHFLAAQVSVLAD